MSEKIPESRHLLEEGETLVGDPHLLGENPLTFVVGIVGKERGKSRLRRENQRSIEFL